MEIQVYQTRLGDFIKMESIGKCKYIGKTFFLGLTNGKVYDIVNIVDDLFSVVDDTDEDYLYSATHPAPMDDENFPLGKWELVEDYTGQLSPFFE